MPIQLQSKRAAGLELRRMSSEDGDVGLPESALDEILRRLEARLESRREREGRNKSELGEH